MKHFSTFFLATVLAAFSLAGCSQQEKPAKYIFLFIGDGMSSSSVDLAESYLSYKAGKLGGEQLSFTRFPGLGFCTTYSANSLITDSAAAGTAIATGCKTNNSSLGVDPQGQPLESVAKVLKNEYGYNIGIFSSVPLNHATPAAFYANVSERGSYYDITCQLPLSNFEFVGGSGILHFSEEGQEMDSEEYLESHGYDLVFGQKEFEKSKAEKIVMVANPRKDRKDKVANYDVQDDELVTLDKMMEDCISHLGTDKAFFIMCEGGEIDWTLHANKSMATVEAILAFDKAIQKAYEFYLEHPKETLIIVTADHETGGLSLGSDESGYTFHWDIVEERYAAGDKLSKEERKALNSASGFDFTSVHHNAGNVPVYSIGKGFEAFCGRIDNTQIKNKILCRQ